MTKSFEIRCSNKRSTRTGDVTCRRYLGDVHEDCIKIICPRCGRRYLIVREEDDGFKAIKLRKDEAALISKPEVKKDSP